MDRHKDSLRKLCRLCGKSQGLPRDRLPIQKEKYAQVILRSLAIDIRNEDSNQYPPYVCFCCSKKLSIWKDKNRRRVSKNPLNIIPHTFQDHSLNCVVCYSAEMHCNTSENVNSLFERIQQLCAAYGYQSLVNENESVTCSVISNEGRVITKRIEVHKNGTWTVEIHGRRLASCALLNTIPTVLKWESCSTLFQVVADSAVCKGNEGFENLCRAKTPSPLQPAIFLSKDGNIEGYEECFSSARTVRHTKCELLVKPGQKRCGVCFHFRTDLTTKNQRLKLKPDTFKDSSKTRNDRLSRRQLEDKVKDLKSQRENLKRKLKNLGETMRDVIDKHGEIIEDDMSASLLKVIEEKEKEVEVTFGKTSGQYLFWQQQKNASSKCATQRRWHPAIIKWCIALYAKSPSAYRMIRGSKYLVLPHESTLKDYTNFITGNTGINYDIIFRIQKNLQFDTLPDYKKNVSILFDEIKIKSGLVYSKSSGKLVGFVDVGDINEEIQNVIDEMKKQANEDNVVDDPPLATHILAVMVRGIFSPLHEVFGWFPCCGFTSYQLYSSIWEAVKVMEYAGFKVRALVSDGASPNRRFYRLHPDNDKEDGVTFYTTNPYCSERKVYFVCDVPHLIKTTRNNWENSGFNNKTRHLHFQGQDISWLQLVNLIEEDIGIRGNNGVVQLRHLPKITHEHLYLTPSLRMKVKLAAQVLSDSVAKAFLSKGRHDTKSTEIFVSMVDKFFDCLNVSNIFQGVRSRKREKEPYQSPDDWRFKWLKEDFLGFLKKWEEESLALPNLTVAEKRKMCLSRETLEGYRITVNSFVSLGRELLQLEGVNYLLSEKFCQDPLEEYFSKQRGSLGRNDTPTVAEFARNAVSLFVSGSATVKASARGNCRNMERPEGQEWDHEPLPRRKRRTR